MALEGPVALSSESAPQPFGPRGPLGPVALEARRPFYSRWGSDKAYRIIRVQVTPKAFLVSDKAYRVIRVQVLVSFDLKIFGPKHNF